MAHTTAPAQLCLALARAVPTADTPPCTELLIDARPDYWVEYEGTAAQMEGEGVIPADFVWPADKRSLHWTANGLDFWLRRNRPRGYKGSAQSWSAIDNWFLRVTVPGHDWSWEQRRRIERKAADLVAEINRQSPEGRRAWNEHVNRVWTARRDVAFQAFVTLLVPARKKPGRPAKARASGPGVA